ncbi:hypothetical protein NUW54_g13080 [Trametes sanguinea]|uniref:Uncharacterized protein n=1 Tax=Trametes sanguinea TaxID=158606 RepID=A0ACC1MQE8_9APHY|nr:hypothetical protein NUW54_g13080 [Trametes sanguinea]
MGLWISGSLSSTDGIPEVTGTCLEKTRKPFWDTVKNLQDTRPGLTVIIVTTYIAVAADVSQSFSIRPGGKKETLGMILKRGGIPTYTLFVHNIAIVVADEVHNVRKPGVRRTALYNGPIPVALADAVHLARLFDIEGFNDDMVDNLRKAQQLESKKARRQEDALANRMEAVNIRLGAAHESTYGPTKTAMFNFVDFLRRQLARYIIHRTPYSKTKDGKPVQDIPPVVEVPVVVELTEEEMEVQTILAERLCEDGGKDLACPCHTVMHFGLCITATDAPAAIRSGLTVRHSHHTVQTVIGYRC